MVLKTKLLALILFLLSFDVYSQEIKAQFVFVEEPALIKFIDDIITESQICKYGVWCIDFNSNNIILSKGDQTLFVDPFIYKPIKLYATVIADNLVFIRIKKENKIFFRKTNFYVDMNSHITTEFNYFENFSKWIIYKIDNKYKVFDKYIHQCE